MICSPATHRSTFRRVRIAKSFQAGRAIAASAAIAVALALAACSAGPPPAPSASFGATVNQIVARGVSTLPLTDQHGHTFDLASLHGKSVMLVPFLTLCSDICPMTTANLGAVQRSIDQAGKGSKLVIVELSVDPGRDTPSRLSAYAGITGATWELVTESPQDLAKIAKFFGFSYQEVPQDNPPAIDWLTHQPLTYDINHSDGFVLLNPLGHEVFATAAAPNYSGHLPAPLQNFLSHQGIGHQRNPPQPGWTANQGIQAVAWLLGSPLSAIGS
jgi:cytochrome oxidase Cu insertion factor (SCO1/SenC/PrrC family)